MPTMPGSETPSQLLKFLFKTQTQDALEKLFEKHVYPFLDSNLPQKERLRLLQVLKQAKSEIEGLSLIEHDANVRSINASIASLRESVKSKRKKGWEEQGQIMEEALNELGAWLPILWKVGVELGSELQLVHESLMFCKKAYDALGSTETLYSRTRIPEVVIKSANGRIVYQVHPSSGSIERLILWVWRELFLSDIINGDETLIDTIATDFEALDIDGDVLERLDVEQWGPQITNAKRPHPQLVTLYTKEALREYELSERRALLLNAHWDTETLAAVPKAINMLTWKRLADFESQPSLELYKWLVQFKPELKERLLEYSRKTFYNADPCPALAPAIEIFLHAEQDEDLLRIMDRTNTLTDIDTGYHEEMRTSISYLMTRTPEVRMDTRVHLQLGLRMVQEKILDVMGRAFPDLTSAWTYLNKVVALKDLSKTALDLIASDDESERPVKRLKYSARDRGASGSTRPPDPLRDPYLSKFCARAGYALIAGDMEDSDEDSSVEIVSVEKVKDGEDFESEEGDSGADEDSSVGKVKDGNDSESEEDDSDTGADVPLSVLWEFQKWVGVLEDWPIKAVRRTINDSLRKDFVSYWSTNGSAFYDVDGVADILARRCTAAETYMERESCRPKLARAIRGLCDAFARDVAEKERIKRDLLVAPIQLPVT